MEEFQYVVERVKPAPVCFGSLAQRDTNPIGKGLSPYQRRFTKELHEKITPQTYNLENFTSSVKILSNRIRSNKGVGGLANGELRWPRRLGMQIPGPGQYDPEPITKIFKPSFEPFIYKVSKKQPPESKTPGPGTYNQIIKRCRRTRVAYNFGRPKVIPAIEEVCTPVAKDVCSKCGEICKGDYWQWNYVTFLCHVCMEEEKLWYEIYRREELIQFRKIRLCWFKHSHEGTTAKVQIIPTSAIVKKRRLENYLELYFKPF